MEAPALAPDISRWAPAPVFLFSSSGFGSKESKKMRLLEAPALIFLTDEEENEEEIMRPAAQAWGAVKECFWPLGAGVAPKKHRSRSQKKYAATVPNPER